MWRLNKKERGFTLLEVLIALVILSIGLLGMASLTASVIRTNSFSDDFTTSTALAQDKLEELINTSYASIPTGTTSDSNNPIDENGSSGGKYSRSWTVTVAGNTKTIDVTVSWSDSLGNLKSTSISTIRSNT